MTKIDPSKTRAVLIGIEAYQGASSLEGPAHDACRLAKHLIDRCVNPDKIHLIVKSTTPEKLKVPFGVKPEALTDGEVNRSCIDRVLKVIEMNAEDELLVLFWSGHGIVENDRCRHLLLSDYRDEVKQTIHLDSLCAFLRSNIFYFKQQIVIVDACAVHYDSFKFGEALAGTFNQKQTNNPEQAIIYASSPGQAALNDRNLKTGIFFKALLPKLNSDLVTWPLNIRRIAQELQDFFESERNAGRSTQVPDWYFHPTGTLAPVKSPKGTAKVTLRDGFPAPTIKELIGRKEQFRELDDAWSNSSVSILKVVGAGGIGKTTLVWHWLQNRKTFGYAGFSQVFAWSSAHQGTILNVPIDSSTLLTYLETHLGDEGFGDRRYLSDPAVTDDYERGVRLGEAFLRIGGVLVLDGIEVMQDVHFRNPELRYSMGANGLRGLVLTILSAGTSQDSPRRLLVITTRFDPPDVTGAGVARVKMPRFSQSEVAQLFEITRDETFPLRRMRYGPSGVVWNELTDTEKNQQALLISNACSGLPLFAFLLAKMVLVRFEGRLADWVGQHPQQEEGTHGSRIGDDYFEYVQKEGTAVWQSFLLFGFFDGPVSDERIQVVLSGKPIAGTTDRLNRMDEVTTAFRALVNFGLLFNVGETMDELPISSTWDLHPLLRARAREILMNDTAAWREGNRRLYNHLSDRAPKFPEDLAGLQPLFEAVTYGCRAGRHREVFQEVLMNRIMRDLDVMFAVTRLGAVQATLLALSGFFQNLEGDQRWGHPVSKHETLDQLTEQDLAILLILTGMIHATLYGYAASGASAAYDALERLPDANADLAVRFALISGRRRRSHSLGELEKMYQMDQELEDLCDAFREKYPLDKKGHLCKLLSTMRNQATTHFFRGNFDAAMSSAKRGIDMFGWFSSELAGLQAQVDVADPAAGCLYFLALSSWIVGQPDRSLKHIADARCRGELLRHAQTEAIALYFQAWIHQFRGEYKAMKVVSEELTQLSSRRQLTLWFAGAEFMEGYARVMTGEVLGPDQSDQMKRGYDRWVEAKAVVATSYWHYLWADANLAACARTTDLATRKRYANKAIQWLDEGLERVKNGCGNWWEAELHRAYADAIASSDGSDLERKKSIEFAIFTAHRMNARSLELRARASHLEYWLGRLSIDLDAKPRASQELQRLESLGSSFVEGQQTADLIRARQLIALATEKLGLSPKS